MIAVEMQVAEGVDEFADLQIALVRDEMGQQGIAGDIEGHTEEEIGAALIELTGEPPIGDIELKETMTRGKRHSPGLHVLARTACLVGQIRRVPGRDHQPARIRADPDGRDQLGELVEDAAVRTRPTAPLGAVDRTETSVLGRPLVPDGHAAVLKPAVVGRAGQEPEQLVDQTFGMHPLGGQQRETLLQIEAHLTTEHRARPRAGAVGLVDAVVDHITQQIEIDAHPSDRRRPEQERVPVHLLRDGDTHQVQDGGCDVLDPAADRKTPGHLVDH